MFITFKYTWPPWIGQFYIKRKAIKWQYGDRKGKQGDKLKILEFYKSSVPTVTHYCKFSDLTQHKFIILHFWISKIGSHWAEIQELAELHSFMDVLGVISVSLPFWGFRGCQHSLVYDPLLPSWKPAILYLSNYSSAVTFPSACGWKNNPLLKTHPENGGWS